jgi:EAL domain-containing protein (putative c-di-GMP-specific phosphodiesterase class I)
MRLWDTEGAGERPPKDSTRWILWSRDDWQAAGRDVADRADDPAAPASTPASSTSVDRTGAAQPPPRLEPGAPVHAIIDARDVDIVFQPVLDARDLQVVGFEALSRGPEGPLHTPRRLFAAARAVGRAGELDWICRAEAFRRFVEAGLHPSVSLLVNVESDSLITPCPEDLLPVIWDAETRLRVFIDIAGESMLRHPVEVLESVRRARAAGWGVVLDDLEFSAAAVSLLPTLEPDVIRLDQRAIRQGSDRVVSALAAALAEVERVGAALLVDNVEEEPGSLARSAPSGYLQGRALHAEGALPATVRPPSRPIPLRTADASGQTPWEVVNSSGGLGMTDVTEESLDRLMRQFVTQAGQGSELPVVGVVSSSYRKTTPETIARYRSALENSPVSILVGRDMDMFQDWRTRGVELPDGHPMSGELCFVALSATHSGVLVARPTAVRDGRAHGWDVGMSHDPMTTRRVMRELLHHVDSLDGGCRE